MINIIVKRMGLGMVLGMGITPVQNSIQQRQKFSDEIFILLASIILIHIRAIVAQSKPLKL